MDLHLCPAHGLARRQPGHPYQRAVPRELCRDGEAGDFEQPKRVRGSVVAAVSRVADAHREHAVISPERLSRCDGLLGDLIFQSGRRDPPVLRGGKPGDVVAPPIIVRNPEQLRQALRADRGGEEIVARRVDRADLDRNELARCQRVARDSDLDPREVVVDLDDADVGLAESLAVSVDEIAGDGHLVRASGHEGAGEVDVCRLVLVLAAEMQAHGGLDRDGLA